MKVVVGLGNPGERYAGTRHNVGFMVVDALGDALGQGSNVGRFQRRFDGDVAEWSEGEQKVLLVKPQTFMNLSGRCVRQALDFYQLTPGDLLVVCDDINLPLGRLRARRGGSAGGHNGLKDIQNHLGTAEYARLRIGIGPPEEDDTVDHVLDRFRPGERPVIQEAILKAAQAVALWMTQDIEACMNQFNAKENS